MSENKNNDTQNKRKHKNQKKTPVIEKVWQKTWDWLYTFEVIRKHKPLKIKSRYDFINLAKATNAGISIKQLNMAFYVHCGSERYLRNASKGGYRYDIDCNPVEEITEEHQQNYVVALKAKRELIARIKRKEQKKQEYEKRKAAKENQKHKNSDNNSRLSFKPRKSNNSDVKIAFKKSRRG